MTGDTGKATDKARAWAQKAHRELNELELQAGIHEKAEAMRNSWPGPHDYQHLHPPPSGTKSHARWLAMQEDQEKNWGYAQERRLGRLYGMVKDASLREQLVSKDQELDEAAYAFAVAELNEARDNLHEASNARPSWGYALLLLVACVMLGDVSYDLIGAIVGAVAGGLLAVGYIDNCKRGNRHAVDQATADYNLQRAIVDEMIEHRTDTAPYRDSSNA